MRRSTGRSKEISTMMDTTAPEPFDVLLDKLEHGDEEEAEEG